MFISRYGDVARSENNYYERYTAEENIATFEKTPQRSVRDLTSRTFHPVSTPKGISIRNSLQKSILLFVEFLPSVLENIPREFPAILRTVANRTTRRKKISIIRFERPCNYSGCVYIEKIGKKARGRRFDTNDRPLPWRVKG